MAEDDETSEDAAAGSTPAAARVAGRPVKDNSLGRLTLCDGVFAIAMTLLALDLMVPDPDVFGHHPTDWDLRHELAKHSATYLSFLLSFYVVATYWMRHRQLMRSVTAIHPVLIRDTVFLLLVVVVMPFASGLLGTYGSVPFALAFYGAINAIAIVTLMVLTYDIGRLGLDQHVIPADRYTRRWQSWLTLGVFLLAIPAAYILGSHGPYVLILLAVPDRITWLRRLTVRAKRAT